MKMAETLFWRQKNRGLRSQRSQRVTAKILGYVPFLALTTFNFLYKKLGHIFVFEIACSVSKYNYGRVTTMQLKDYANDQSRILVAAFS